MTIKEYNRYGRVRDYVLCEDPRTDNAPKRRALFEEFGGKVHNPNAEIFGDEVDED